MREIKFRAYNRDQKKFFFWDIKQGFGGYPGIWGPVEQFTGLKDKNGREIFEGDLIGVSENSDMPSGSYTACFDKGSFIAKNEDTNLETWCAYWHEMEVEIIGNIHEHEEPYDHS